MVTTYGSIFSGAGGFDLGCDAAGWECKWQIEWDKKATGVLERHWPNVERITDVNDVDGSKLLPVDVITFGFPCQDLSIGGKQIGLDGERSGLFFEATRIIREMREATNGQYPRTIIIENVTGLLTANKGSAMGRCLDEVAKLGTVEIEWRVLDSQYFGVPQRRRRVFIVANFNSREAGSSQILSKSESSNRHSGTGFKEGQGTTRTIKDSAESIAFVKVIRSGARDSEGNLPPEVWREEQTSPTLTVCDNASESRSTVLVVKPGSSVRRLTPRETERLQGWPDDHTRWDANGKENADWVRYKMTGNGVATPVARWVAEQVGKALEGAE